MVAPSSLTNDTDHSSARTVGLPTADDAAFESRANERDRRNDTCHPDTRIDLRWQSSGRSKKRRAGSNTAT